MYLTGCTLPQNAFLRFTLTAWNFSGLVLSVCYSGELISFMTLPTEAASINTIDEFAEAVASKRVIPYAITGSFYFDFFKVSTSNAHILKLNLYSYFKGISQ